MSLKNIGKKQQFRGRVQHSSETVELTKRARTSDATDYKYLEMKEIDRLFSVIKSKRDKAMFRLAYHRGLRAHEVGKLQMSHFRDRDGLLFIPRGKGSVQRDHRLLEVELRPLRAWLKERGYQDGPLFPSRQGKTGISRSMLHRLMKHYCRLAGIDSDKAHMHALKHSCGTHLREMHFEADEIQDHLDHRDSSSTDVYMHFSKRRRSEMNEKLREQWR